MTDTSASAPTPAQAVLDALAIGITAAHAYDRADLAMRLHAAREVLATPDVRVVFIGEFKQGKSSLINALLNSKVCPVDDDIATAVPTSIRYGDPRQAWVVTASAHETPDVAGFDRQAINFDDIGRYVTDAVDDLGVRGVEVALPRKLLDRGLVLVDTPGVGGLGSAHATASLGALSVADAAIFISDASQEFTQTELNFLAQAVDMCPRVICVMTKIDFYPAWRRVKGLNEQHLRNAGHDLAVLPVSSALRIEAIRRSDKVLNTESGFPGLLAVVDDVVSGAEERNRRRAESDLLAVTDQLIGQFETEAVVLDDPERGAEVVARLEEAKARSERLKSQASKWSVTLNDGVGDLTSNVDFDFRQRMRAVTAEADAAIEASDPMQTWAEFEPWLASRVSFDVVANYRLLTDSALELSRTVAEHFELDSDQVLDQLELQSPAHVLSRVSVDTSLEFDDVSVRGQGLTLLKGSYSGVLMFTMLGSMVGLALGPLAIGIGLAMGSKGLKTERDRQRTQRRAQAKVAVRKYSDEVTFQVGKDSRDTLRQTQRQLRDYYTARAEELHRSTTEALTAATKAAQSSESDRTTRRRSIDAELTRLRALRTRALTLAGDVSAS